MCTASREWVAFQLGKMFLYFMRRADPDMAFGLIKSMYHTMQVVEDMSDQQERYRDAVSRGR